MNFFYEEPGRKQVLYYKKGREEGSPIFSPAVSSKENPSGSMTSRPDRMFRFSILIFDMVALNVILISLLHLLNFEKGDNNQPLLFTANVAWILSAYLTALYFGKEKFLIRTIQSYLLFTALTLFLIFILKMDFSRSFVMLSFLAFGVCISITRIIFIGANTYITNTNVNRFIVLGYNDLSQKLVGNLRSQKKGSKMEGYFDDYVPVQNKSMQTKVLGTINESLEYALKNEISEIYSTIPPEENPEIYDIAQQAEKNFIRFRFVPDFTTFINRRVHISFVQDLPVLSLRSEPLEDVGSRFKKRVFDVVFSTIIILGVLSWLVPIIAILIKLDSRGPVFFKQLRSGKNNMPFLCFKFRSLHVNKDSDVKQVTRNDNRYTRVGKFLRKSNLDEFPQFFNVFQGYMSIVGPRPHMLKHTEQYSEMINQYMIRHYVKPGITGLAQVNGYRGEITREEDLTKRIEFDIKYMENWSMLIDIQIIFQTIYLSIKGDKNAF